MNLFKGLWACVRVLFILLRHAHELPTDEELRSMGIEPYHNTGVPPWAFRGLQQGHHHR